jgi:hypothetical protein
LELVLSFSVLSALSVTAQVTFYGVQKGPSYTQTIDDTPPTTTNGYGIFAFFDTTSPEDASSFTVMGSDTIYATGSGTSFGGVINYPDKVGLDSGFNPGGTYNIVAYGGTLDGSTGSIPIPSDNYAEQMYLTGSGLSAALAINPHLDFSFNVGYSIINAYDLGLGNSQAFAIFDQTTGSFIYNVYNDSAGQSPYAFTIPSSLLLTMSDTGDAYLGQLTDFNTTSPTATGDFFGIPVSDGFTQTTLFDIVVVPEPGQWGALIFLGAVATFGLRRARAGLL